MAFSEKRYDSMIYRRCGNSGLKLPAISLGCWHNFGDEDDRDEARTMLHRAFDLGITHFDLANNYGPPPGSAEQFVGKVLKEDFAAHRDELIISTKAGYYMWPGPYGEWGSKKYLIASLDQSLKRLGLDYVDIYYSHRPDPDTPLEETMDALDQVRRQGKALYVGISSYNGWQTAEACHILRQLGTPMTIHQPYYNMTNRWIENELYPNAERLGYGIIAFCPLAQGLLTDKYLGGVPKGSRGDRHPGLLGGDGLSEEMASQLGKLNHLAKKRGQSLAQLALAWVLRDERMTSALIGASRVSQVEENVKALERLDFSKEELDEIEGILEG